MWDQKGRRVSHIHDRNSQEDLLNYIKYTKGHQTEIHSYFTLSYTEQWRALKCQELAFLPSKVALSQHSIYAYLLALWFRLINYPFHSTIIWPITFIYSLCEYSTVPVTKNLGIIWNRLYFYMNLIVSLQVKSKLVTKIILEWNIAIRIESS